MTNWLAAIVAQDQPAILVTVAHIEGSAPREPGAKMVVTADNQYDTIGGGHLEWCAVDAARKMLATAEQALVAQRRIDRFPLGPTLGQCCGGVVYLAFERVDAVAREVYANLQRRQQSGQSSLRIVALDLATPVNLVEPEDRHHQSCHIHHDGASRFLIDPCMPHPSRLFLFGAGHVGAAIIRALADLPCHVTWVDERDDQFPTVIPANVTCEATDTPEALIDGAPPGASFLVMTHSHPLDLRLAECILRRADIGWFGLIGSRTKRIQFERRLRARDVPEDRLHAMVCPIGVPGIEGKAPAVIAVAVAAQLLQTWETQQLQTKQPIAQGRYG